MHLQLPEFGGDRNRKEEANEQTKRINIIGVNKKRRGGFSLIQICAALIDRPTNSVGCWFGSFIFVNSWPFVNIYEILKLQ